VKSESEVRQGELVKRNVETQILDTGAVWAN
jgi:hypothetical protein